MPKQYIDAELLDPEFSHRVKELITLRRQQSEIEAEMKKIREWLTAHMKEVNCEAVRGPGFRASLYQRESKRVSPERLVALGVDPAIVEQATEVSKYEVLDVREERQ